MDCKKLIMHLCVQICMVCQLYAMDPDQYQLSIMALPEDAIQEILLDRMVDDWSRISVVPEVCKQWNEITHQPAFIKKVMRRGGKSHIDNPYKYGYQEYKTINKKLHEVCWKGNASRDEVVEILKNPLVDVNYSRENLGYTDPILGLIKYSNIDLLSVLIEHGADMDLPFRSNILSDISLGYAKKEIDISISLLGTLIKAGAKDKNGVALPYFVKAARYVSGNYASIPLLKDAITNPNKKSSCNENNGTALHMLLAPSFLTVPPFAYPQVEALTIFMNDLNANPHIVNDANLTAYDYAREWANKGHPEYLEIITQHDKGIEWYEKNQNQ